MEKCRICGKKTGEFEEVHCGRCDKIAGSVMADLAAKFSIPLVLPSMHLCTDNGAMIAYAGYLMANAGCRHDLDLEAIPRGRVVPSDWICDA